MRKVYIYFACLIILVSFVILPINIHVEASWWANQQPEVCWWPSKTMSMYFDFQNDVRSVLFWSKVNEKLFLTSNDSKGLFSNKVLDLPSPLDLLAYNVLSSAKSIISTSSTSVVLLLLASVSVAQSSVDGFVILFKDRPIVRDYKRMLDIETDLFDIAYYRSKQVDLTRPFDSEELLNQFSQIIETYQNKWLLEKTNRVIPSRVSIADVLLDLISMNSAMRNFIVFRWDGVLSGYNWCLWVLNVNECDKNSSILRFDSSAIAQLDEDYKWIWAFWACNSYASNFRNTISKSVDNNISSVKVAMQDVWDASTRLWNATIWWIGNGRWNLLTDPCNMSEYEMAQLRAYWWWNWKCWDGVGLSSTFLGVKEWISAVANWVSSAYWQVKEYLREKKAQRELMKQRKNLSENAASNLWDLLDRLKDVSKKIRESSTTQEKQGIMTDIYWTWIKYNPEFKDDILNDFLFIYEWTMEDYKLSQQTAIESDFSYELKKIRWLVDQLDEVIDKAGSLEKNLQKISDYQCNG